MNSLLHAGRPTHARAARRRTLSGLVAAAVLSSALAPAALAGSGRDTGGSPVPAPTPQRPAVTKGRPIPQRLVDPNLVIVRPAVPENGSGRLGDYGRAVHISSAPEVLTSTAKQADGCLLIGDSMANAIRTRFLDRLSATGHRRCSYDVWPGRPTEVTANMIDWMAVKRGGLPKRLVVLAGSNDVFNTVPFRFQAGRIAATAKKYGSTVIWVEIWIERARFGAKRKAADRRNSGILTTDLRALGAADHNVRVVPWRRHLESIGAAGRARILTDGVHPDSSGQKVLIDLIMSRWER